MPQDPASIHRQIEDTRAELAETIDAIAEIVSPKRVAERANLQVKSKVAEIRQKLLPPGDATAHAELEAGSNGVARPVPLSASPTTAGPEVEIRTTVHWGRLAVATGTLLLLVAGANRRRRRRR